MKLVFIYGPPAVGKLTVATELGRITSFAVFDNHLSLDCVLPVFGFGTKSLGKLVEQIRLSVIEAGRARGRRRHLHLRLRAPRGRPLRGTHLRGG